MQHFFVSPEQVKEEKIYVEGGDVNHMKNVLRMKTGEELTVNDGEGSQYLCAVEFYEADMAVLKILEKKQDESELASKIYLFQGLPKQDKMELIVQKSVELGAYQVIPVATKRAVVKLDAKKAKKKVERWQQIAVSAAKQAGRGIILRWRSMHLCAGIEAGRRTGRCPDPIRAGKRDGRDEADHRRDQTGAVGRHLYRTGRRL